MRFISHFAALCVVSASTVSSFLKTVEQVITDTPAIGHGFHSVSKPDLMHSERLFEELGRMSPEQRLAALHRLSLHYFTIAGLGGVVGGITMGGAAGGLVGGLVGAHIGRKNAEKKEASRSPITMVA